MSTEVQRTEQEWQSLLTPEQYQVLRQKGTERPFSGRYVDTKQDGMYRCAACGNELFDADAKFESGTGWPASCGANRHNVTLGTDTGHGMVRTEVSCAVDRISATCSTRCQTGKLLHQLQSRSIWSNAELTVAARRIRGGSPKGMVPVSRRMRFRPSPEMSTMPSTPPQPEPR
jgi:peptide-methionine (R)-S-oxide reductase